ncbi:MAG TPA: NAD(P)/FAD-dependent oxidoreductase [Dehalococcoidia bacterium]|nr:NAD(P)/FAD-dependent oxidoreductase [Dehalococcoidia bacterium]
MSDNNSWDAIVIGSGLGGLTAAAYLATNGRRTLVLEQHYVAGGNSHVFRRRALKGKIELEFDVGVHYIGDCRRGGLIPSVLHGVGIDDIEYVEMDPDGFDTLMFPGLTVRVPKGWDRYRQRLIDALPDDETGIHRCVEVLEALAGEMPRIPLPVKTDDLPRLMQEFPNFFRWGMRPLSALFDDCGLGQKARAVLAGESGTYALPPSRTPVLLHAMLMDHYLRDGAYYPKGGGQVFAARLVDVLRGSGGELRTQVRVERILVEDGHVTGVRLATGEEIQAPVVISNADLKRTYLEMLGEEHVSPQTAARMKQLKMALPLFCVYLGLDIDLRGRIPNTNYLYFPSYDIEGMYEDCFQGRLPSNLMLYLTSGSVKDPETGRIAPKGYTSLEIMTLVPADYPLWDIEEGPTAGEKYHRKPGYRSAKEQLTEAMIDGAEQIIPGLKDHIIWKEAATPITQERFTLSTGGTSYGIELSPEQFGPGRPGTSTEVKGLYVVGASTMYAHGIAGVMRGGIACAGAVLGKDLMREVMDGRVFGSPALAGAGRDPWRASR